MKALIFQSCMLHEMKPFGIYRAQETFLVHRILLLTFALVPSQTSLPWYIGANYVYIFPDCVYIHTKWAHTTLNVSMLTCCKLLSRTYVRTPKSNTPTWNPWCVCTWMVCVSQATYVLKKVLSKYVLILPLGTCACIHICMCIVYCFALFIKMAFDMLYMCHKTRSLHLGENRIYQNQRSPTQHLWELSTLPWRVLPDRVLSRRIQYPILRELDQLKIMFNLFRVISC